MAVNKVVMNTDKGEQTLIDLTDDSVTPETLAEGETAHDKSGNSITGTFTLNDELSTQDELIAAIKDALQGKAAGGGSTEPTYRNLYQRVEYIEPAEEETYPYILTDIFAKNDIGAEIVASFPTLQDKVPMGSREDSGTTRFYVVYPMSENSIYYGFNTGSSISCQLKVDTIYRCQTNFLDSRLVNVYDEDGNRKGGTSLSATLTPHTAPIAIFGYNRADTGVVSSKREYKLYSARISKKHDVIREYIPCYRKSDGVVGLYEKFTGVFLTSESDGKFTKGSDISWG